MFRSSSLLLLGSVLVLCGFTTYSGVNDLSSANGELLGQANVVETNLSDGLYQSEGASIPALGATAYGVGVVGAAVAASPVLGYLVAQALSCGDSLAMELNIDLEYIAEHYPEYLSADREQVLMMSIEGVK